MMMIMIFGALGSAEGLLPGRIVKKITLLFLLTNLFTYVIL